MVKPQDHPRVASPRIGVLLINLGTPEAPTPQAVRRYLAEFLSDRRVVEISPLIWQPILRGIILNTRPRKSAHAYAQIWMEQGSPLAVHTAAQAEALQQSLGDSVLVDWAMRYGQPSIARRLQQLQKQGCTRILIAPLYPQYCGATVASVMDAVGAALAKMRWQPALRTLPPYYDDPAYIAALHQSVQQLERIPDILLASFHGMPARTLALGDPYYCHCMKTARLLSESLGRSVEVSFQSRFGRAKWLEPSTETMLRTFGEQGARGIAIITPGFSVDCLETLEEIGMRGREIFRSAGGTDFTLIPCLNAQSNGITMLESIIARELAAWLHHA